MERIINWVPFHWAQSAWQQPHYPVDNWSVLPFISSLNAIKYHYWLSNLQSALGSRCLLRQGSASQIRGERSVRCNRQRESHHTVIFSTLPSKHGLMVFWGWILQNAGIGYHIWCLEYFTPNRVLWKSWVYLRSALPGFTHIKLLQCWTWMTMKSRESYFGQMEAEGKIQTL